MRAIDWRDFLPFLDWWPEVSRGTLRADIIAAIIGAIVVLPQGVAFARIAGMPPEYGLYTAMVPGVIASVFGSSRLMVTGPATPASIVLFSVLSTFAVPGSERYVELAITLALMVGCVQLAMGLARMGALVNFISHSVVVGFTAGAAILIAASQIKDFLGLHLKGGLQVHEVLVEVYEKAGNIHVATAIVGAATLTVGIYVRQRHPRFPYMIAAIGAGTLLATAINFFFYRGHPADGVALVGQVSAALPPFSKPDLSFSTIKQLAPVTLAVTLFCLTEAVSIARALAARTGDLVDGNQEMVGQGLANVMGSFFSSYVSTGSFNRSGLNYESGARTPISAILTSLILMGVVVVVAPAIAWLPKAALAGVLFIVAWGIVDFDHISHILKASRSDSTVLVVTFAATLLFTLDFAILLGVLLSLVMYLHRASRPRVLVRVPDPRKPKRQFSTDASLPECPQLKLVRIDGALFFGAVSYVAERLRVIFKRNLQQKHLLVLARTISFIDVAGAEMLARENRLRREVGGQLYFHQLQESARRILDRGGYMEEIGAENFFDSKGEAIAQIFERLDRDICRRCDKRIFNECKSVPREEPQTQTQTQQPRKSAQPA